MRKRTGEEFEQLAAQVRKEFYARTPADRTSRDRRVRRAARRRSADTNPQPGEGSTDRAGKRPQPCPGKNAWWRGLSSKARSMATTLASPDVSDEIYELRQSKCAKCPYDSEVGGEHYCGCCGCPTLKIGRFGSHLGYKNRKAGWGCPAPAPAFGPELAT